jgi:hypothetical protein
MLRALYSLERSRGIHWSGGWVGLRAGLDAVETGKMSFLCHIIIIIIIQTQRSL